ncbi:MAG: ATP-binding cassette domain-containing protein, partial [Candidatus Nealsonbacteria bacterium]|nr:ATP-binding cassette domain-containing protein [Candidatus Nealsonbacteria bacterium]
SVGQLVMFVGYFNLIQRPLQGLAWQWRVFKTGVESIKRVNNVLEISAEDYNKKGVVLENFKGKIAFKNVYFKYKGKKNTLEDINFTIMPGQKAALVGASGEGKTTLVDLISLYFKPAKGKIYIDGIDTQKMNLKYLREHIAYVPQEIILFHDTVYNNIKLGNPSASRSQIIEASKSANAHDFISSFPKRYEQLVGERGIKLSAGQKQRIAIARALLRNPRILILDEATSSLDSKTEKLVQEAMEKLFKGRTVLIIAHRLSTIRSADKIFVLKKKRIAEEGTHEELLKEKGDYFELHSLQNKSNS